MISAERLQASNHLLAAEAICFRALDHASKLRLGRPNGPQHLERLYQEARAAAKLVIEAQKLVYNPTHPEILRITSLVQSIEAYATRACGAWIRYVRDEWQGAADS